MERLQFVTENWSSLDVGWTVVEIVAAVVVKLAIRVAVAVGQ